MKSLERLSLAALREAGRQCCVRTDRDEKTLRDRVEMEGVSFLTITLPSFEKDLTRALSDGRIGSGLFVGFATTKGGLPRFLSGFLRLIFDERGYVRDDVSCVASAYRAVRQVLLLLKKVEMETTPARVKNALDGYVIADAEIPRIDPDLLSRFERKAFELFHEYFSDLANSVYDGEVLPRYSSGNLAGKETYNGRYSSRVWTDRLEEVFPHWDYLSVNWRDSYENPPAFLSRSVEPPVRVTTVPKTMKGPRIIAMEPAWMQYTQQGIMHLMASTLRERQHSGLWSEICTDSQEYNREMARLAHDNGFATIDLSEASDRVSLELVQALFKRFPILLKAIMACRSERAQLPSGEIVSLRKFASMGSSLCFPMETLVFYTIVKMGMEDCLPRSVTVLDREIECRVYGDDMIVPVESARTVIGLLEAFGLRVNSSKTFVGGNFHESCGADWYAGQYVSPVRASAVLPDNRRQSSEIMSTIEFHNRLYEAGWFSTADFVRKHLEGILRLPVSAPGFSGCAIWSWDEEPHVRFHPHYHKPVQMVYKARESLPDDPLDGYGAFLKISLNSAVYPLKKSHLQKDGRPRCVGMNIGWIDAT